MKIQLAGLFVVSLMVLFGLSSCATDPLASRDTENQETEVAEKSAAKPPVEKKPFAPELEVVTENGVASLWLKNANTGSRVRQLYKGDSQSLKPELSADNQWIILSEQPFSDLQTVHLFKRVGETQYRKIEREKFTGVLWGQFSSEISQGVIARYSTTFQGWRNGGNAVALTLGAQPPGGDWVKKDYEVDLTQF